MTTTHDDSKLSELELLKAQQVRLERELSTLKRIAFGVTRHKLPGPFETPRRGRLSADELRYIRMRRPLKPGAKRSMPRQDMFRLKVKDPIACPVCHEFPVGWGSGLLEDGGSVAVTVKCYEPDNFIETRYLCAKLICACEHYNSLAEVPLKHIAKGRYSNGFMAHVITSACADSAPLESLDAYYKNEGAFIRPKTLVALFEGAAELLRPVYTELMKQMTAQRLVHATETLLVGEEKGKPREGYLWTFLGGDLVGYHFSDLQESQAPAQVLGASKGDLVLQPHMGQGDVASLDGRTQVGCLAQLGRLFFNASLTHPEANIVLDMLLSIYTVEHEAWDGGVRGTKKHRTLRKKRSKKAMQAIKEWCLEEAPKHPSDGELGQAIGQTLSQWALVTQFVEDPLLPLDHLPLDRAERVAAMGRENFIFTGHDDAGKNAAVLYSLVMSCHVRDIDPVLYLADLLWRLDKDPTLPVEDLLPHRWGMKAAPTQDIRWY